MGRARRGRVWLGNKAPISFSCTRYGSQVSSEAPVALVTGASRGIGRVVTARLAASGYRVAAIARTAAALEAVVDETGAVPHAVDVTDAAAVAETVGRIEAELGPLRLLVNNAGIAGADLVSWEQSPDDWWKVFEVNMFGAYLFCRSALPGMVSRRAGRVVNVSSAAAFFRIDADDSVLSSAYMASKAALIRFTEALAGEARSAGVTVFAISPGMIKTDMTAAVFADIWDEANVWSPPELAADLIEFLESGALDALSGRYIHARNDDWRGMADRIPEILERDLHALRVVQD